MKKDSLCVVMPVYNEEAIIHKVLEDWHKALDLLGGGVDYVIRAYNDGSMDNSLNEMKNAVRSFGDCKIEVIDKKNGGHGQTILQGYKDASRDGYEWIFQVDSDGEMSPCDFVKLWSQRLHFDFLIGRRGGRVQAFSRRMISLVSRFIVRIFYGKGVWDVNSPYRLMRMEKFRIWYEEIPSTTFAPNVVLSGVAAHEKLRCYEIPVPQHDRTTGEVSIKRWKLVKAAVKSFSQTVAFAARFKRTRIFFAALCVFSVFAKFLISFKGWNFDYESYCIVADIVNSDGNVYAQTTRYNYGPIWFNILGIIKNIFGPCFRYGIIAVLSLVDVGIAFLLWHRKLIVPSFLFLLSYISTHISGFHNQFDNLAVLLGFLSLLLFEKFAYKDKISSYIGVVIGALLMGVSLITKHIFCFIPFWFLFSKVRFRMRVLMCVLPLLLFAISFLPYAKIQDLKCQQIIEIVKAEKEEVLPPVPINVHPFEGIVQNVFKYKSQPSRVYKALMPSIVQEALPYPFAAFVFFMLIIGFLSRKMSFFNRGLIYCLSIFIFSPSIAMQYYAIPCISASVYWWPFGIMFHLGAGAAFTMFEGVATLHPVVLVPSLIVLIGCLIVAMKSKDTKEV